ncbi:MAG: hypothetical protein WDN31_12850 [Hyphomicrobium sp.]
MIAGESVLARKLGAFLSLSTHELQRLAELQSAPQRVKRGKQLIREGEARHEAFILQAGWACSYKDLSSGGRRSSHFQ